MTLAEFLLARIAEDEAAARRAGDAKAVRGSFNTGAWIEFDDGSSIVLDDAMLAALPARHLAALDNAARFRPARVLAECEAKRQIVLQWQECQIAVESDDGGAWAEGMAYALELAMQHLALPYADHPDYREEWRP